MKALIFFTTLLLLAGCKEDCMEEENCDRNSLVVLNPDSRDLRKYVIRTDSTSWYGHANAIKSVPEQGEIEWVGNNSIGKLPSGECYLGIANYVDSSWVDLEFWANLREIINIKIDLYCQGVQKILDEAAYKNNPAKNYALYLREYDDYSDASWDIDLDECNYLIVSKIDEKTKIAEGEFDLHFKIKKQSTLPGVVYSDKIRFRCGNFKAKIYE